MFLCVSVWWSRVWCLVRTVAYELYSPPPVNPNCRLTTRHFGKVNRQWDRTQKKEPFFNGISDKWTLVTSAQFGILFLRSICITLSRTYESKPILILFGVRCGAGQGVKEQTKKERKNGRNRRTEKGKEKTWYMEIDAWSNYVQPTNPKTFAIQRNLHLNHQIQIEALRSRAVKIRQIRRWFLQ